MAQEIAVDAEALAREMLSEREPGKPKGEPPHEGAMKRKLTCMDRRLVLEAVEAYARRPQQQRGSRPEADGIMGNYRSMIRLARLRKKLDAEGVVDYYEAMEDALAERREAWTRGMNAYARALNEGTPEERMPPKPPRRAPVLTPEELKGPEASYGLSPRDEVYVQDALQAMDWSRFPAEDVVAVCAKFGLKGDED